MTFRPAGLLLFLAFPLHAGPIRAQQLPIPDGSVREGVLSFDGHASVGAFTGRTTEVSGRLQGAEDLAGVSGWVEAPVRSLATGKDKRDRDLNKSMESDTFPVLRFELVRVEPGGGRADSLAATLVGRMILHGVTRDVELPATLAFRDTGVRVTSDFPLNLKDYHIGGLSRLLGILKMDEHIEVHVDLTFDFVH
jgi:polyisoprenoid-binding protein YceI